MASRTIALSIFSTFLLTAQSCASIAPSQCTSNWKVTGYYTPVESEYTGASHSITVTNHGQQTFPRSFLDSVKMEGWGKTRFGWYLGYYGGRWHHNPHPLDSVGKPLSVGAVATDPGVVATGSTVVIADLSEPFNKHRFVARDVGTLVKHKHIDIYTGEGDTAKELTWHVTGEKTVCIYSS